MAAILHEVSAKEVMQQLTLSVRLTGFKRARIRAWLGIKIIALGVAVIGCKAEVSDDWAL